MAEEGSQRSCVVEISNHSALPTECCYCRRTLRDLLMLKCLHHCCQSCLGSNVNSMATSNATVKCPVCSDSTDLRLVSVNSLVYSYSQATAVRSDAAGGCRTCDAEAVAAAEFWCVDCCMGLCASCYSWHSKFNGRHRSAELDEARSWPLSLLIPAAQCGLHKRQMQMHCFTCREPKCVTCYESCKTGKHDLHALSSDQTRKHIYAVIDVIRGTVERLSCLMSSLQKKSRAISSSSRGLYKTGHAMLVRRKRLLQDSNVRVFDTSINVVCVNLQRVWCECSSVVSKPVPLSTTATSLARQVCLFSDTSVRGHHLLREKCLLKVVALSSTSSFGASLRRLRKSVRESGSFAIDSSVPLTAQVVLSACLGSTDRKRVAPPAPLFFGQATVSFQTPTDCFDMSVTRDGHVLLAALEHGLLMYSDRGQQLSSWRPATRSSDGEDDGVRSVAVLSDGRAAVSVTLAQLVVLLRRSTETGDSWLEDRQVAELQSPSWRLAVHEDLLAVTDSRLDEEQQSWMPGRHLQLMRLSSGQLLYNHSSEYVIWSVALTALCIVTTSHGRVKRNSGARPCMVDAFSHAGDFLWRHETSDDELVFGLCAAATWSRVYATAVRRDRRSRVMAIGGADGRDMRDVMGSSTHGLQNPMYLSLSRGEQRTVLAVMSYDEASKQTSTVTMYEATSN